MPRASCKTCGARLPAKSNFCPQCGTHVESGDTVVQELPPMDPASVPVEHQVSQRRLFGVPPATLLLVLGLLGIAGSIALLVAGLWPWALITLGLSLFMLTGFASETRRLPDETSEVSRASLGAVRAVRARAGVAVETVAAHGSARIELARLRSEADAVRREREVQVLELGAAVYDENDEATRASKERIRELDREIEEREAKMAKVTMDAMERIGRAKLQVQSTRIMPEGTELPDEAPEPAQVPEPFPPPDEGDPPTPARVPEPFPPPDEGDRPRPPEIPEPGPTQGSK